ncbi:hypothetical protein K1719_010627 [Acacia pycnantha]|nr:hypothetical protein K1719_010627 [Acacia pycnantha]
MDGYNRNQVPKPAEASMTEKKTANAGEVVVAISLQDSKMAECNDVINTVYAASRSPLSNVASPDLRNSPSPRKPPKHPLGNENPVQRKSPMRPVYSKPKSRFGEQPYSVDAALFEGNNDFTLQDQMAVNSPCRNSFNKGSPNNKSRIVNRTASMTSSITPKTPFMASPGPAGEDEDEILYRRVEISKGRRKTVTTKVLIEWVVFLCIMGCLEASLTVNKLKNTIIWGLECWRWCVLVLVTFCGMLITNWIMHIIVFLIELNFLLRKRVLYFVHRLKKSVQVFIWLGLILITWVLLINQKAQRSELTTKVLNGVTQTLISLLIGVFLWFLKTLSLKILASKFHVRSFLDRIQQSIFHQYVLQTLSGPPLIEEAEKIGRSPSIGQFSFRSTKGKGGIKKEVIDVAKLHKIKQEKVSAGTMKILVGAVKNSRLSTISNALDETFEQTDKEITNEMEATAAAYNIFRNVATPGSLYIEEDDLQRFMIEEEVNLVFSLFDGAETGRIDRKALTSWVLKVYQERKALAHALGDTKTAVNQLSKLVTGILVVVTIIVWLLLMEIASTKLLLFFSSQLVLVTFMFGNTCKNIFEAIIFVFVMHPFDVGDRCVVDGVQLLVEEMNILTTVFLKLNNEKVYYPNSILATKPISNYYRSPDMGDTVEFCVDFMTPLEKLGALKEKVKRYLERNPQHWHSNHNVVLKEIVNVNKLKMALYVTHTMNFQEWGAKNRRRSELMTEIKKIFEELNIKYNLLPQAVHLSNTGSDTTLLAR